jgi:DNA-binding XRE family transcriptional regulator
LRKILTELIIFVQVAENSAKECFNNAIAMDQKNSLRKIREDRMMSKAELARKANVTVQTIDRIEKGKECRLDTKRKIILALGYNLADRDTIFKDGEAPE